MKEFWQKKTTRKTFFGGAVVFASILAAFVVLLMVHALSDFKINAAGWFLLLFLSLVWLVQWAVHLFVFNSHTSEDGNSLEMDSLTWILSFLPTAVCLVLIAVLYGTLHSKFDFFAVSGRNFSMGLLIMLFVVGLIGAAVMVLKQVLPAHEKAGAKEVIMKVVGKNDPEAASAMGSLAYSGVGEGDVVIPGMPGGETRRPDYVFPDLISMDEAYKEKPYEPVESDDVTLSQLCSGFNRYLESKNMFYSIDTVRSFISGLACSHFIILEGVSGMGKTSLPKYFAEYTGSNVSFTPVQSSWRDRSDILGYYNDFVGQFKETPFLRSLYKASYEKDNVNMLVLDEMNLSRVEYYFADFLSVLELDESQWKIELMPVSTGGAIPEKLQDCSVVIPNNVWFIGTANKDDSTYALTDKVYDRAVIIDFARRKEEGTFKGEIQPVRIGNDKLAELFASAAERLDYKLSASDYDKFTKLTEFMYDMFDVNFGNRILNQITTFVPVYVACGGTAAKALDLMFSRKVLRKLEGRFDDEVKENLERLERLVLSLYGADDFSETLDSIAKLKRKMY